MLETLQDFIELHSLPRCLETVPGFVSLVKELKKKSIKFTFPVAMRMEWEMSSLPPKGIGNIISSTG